jgi:Ca2+-binding RTX toxin-like protein
MTTTYTISGYRQISDDDTNNVISFDVVDLSVTFPETVTTLSYTRDVFDNGLVTEDIVRITPFASLETLNGVIAGNAHGNLAFIRDIQVAETGDGPLMVLRYFYDDSLTAFADGGVTVEYEFFIGGVEVRDVTTQAEYDALDEDDIIGPAPAGQSFGPGVDIPLALLNWDSIADAEGVTGFDIIGDNDGNDLLGADGPDTMSGERGDDVLTGFAGEDDMRCGVGNDEMYGGDDDDILRGGRGEDTLAGGTDDDRLKGGGGADLFIFDEGMAEDTIVDYEVGTDALQIDGALAGAAADGAAIVSLYGNTEDRWAALDFGGGDVITFRGLETLDGIADDITLGGEETIFF